MLLHLFQGCEDAIAWPWQFLTMLEALLAKPAGGERAVALLPWPVRLWSRLRKPLGADWCDQKAGFWDEAVKGSSALLDALRRLFWDDSTELLGLARCSVLWDYAEFYDSLNRAAILREN